MNEVTQPRIPKQFTVDGAERALAEFLNEFFENYKFHTNREPDVTDPAEIDRWGGRKRPQVVRGFIPRNVTGVINPEAIPDYPAIIVQAKKTSDAFTGSLITILVLFGAFDQNPDYQGYRDVIDMFDAAREALWEKQIIEQTIGLREPFDFEMQDDYWPHFFGLLTSTWTLATPQLALQTTTHSYD